MEAMATSAASSVVCVITGDRLFSRAHPNKLVEDGLAYRVRGDMAEGLAAIKEKRAPTFTCYEDFERRPKSLRD